MDDIETELQEWFGAGWTVTVSERRNGWLNIDAAHPLSHGMAIQGIGPDEALVYAKRGWARERANVAAAPTETPHQELLMGLRIMIDAERLDEHDRGVIATSLRGVGLITRDEADWIRVIEPLI